MQTVGILGGMGPAATVDLFDKIVSHTDASTDHDHLHIVIDNNTKITDRTAAILAGSDEPVSELVTSAQKLERMGADFLIMPCNTAHFFYPEIVKQISIPMLHMVEITAETLVQQGLKKIGLLATSGVIQSQVYTQILSRKGIDVIIPNESDQIKVMNLIYQGIKANNLNYDLQSFIPVVETLETRGAEAIILGCTELPLAFAQYQELTKFNTIDPTLELAKAAIQFAGAKVK